MRVLSAIAVGVVIALSGCATTSQPAKIEPAKEDLIRLQTMPVSSAISEAEVYIDRSREQELDFLTPKHFDLANKALSEAKALLSKNQPFQEIVQKVAVAEAVLKNSEMVARKIKSSLSDELSIKDSLEELNAPEIYRSEYGSLVARLDQIIRQVEEGKKADSIKERQSLIQEMTKLEIKSIKYNALNEPKEILKRVKNRGGSELAPVTYQEALEVYSSAERFIAANPHMREAVEKLAQEALFAAKRALYIAEEVAALSQRVKVSLEQIVLDEEYRMFRIARAITNKDVRDNPLEVQSELLADTVAEITTQQRKQEDLVVALRDTLIKVRDASAPSNLNATIKSLKKEKNEWLAKDALYSAKLSQLTAELEARESQLRLIGSRLNQSERALSMSEMENQALSMTIQEQKPGATKPEDPLENEPVVDSDTRVLETATIEAKQKEPELASEPVEKTTDNQELSPEPTPVAKENTAKSNKELVRKKRSTSIIDRSTTDIIADLLAEPKPEEKIAITPDEAPISKPSSKKLDPTKALASDN